MKIGLFGWSAGGRPVMSGVQLGLLRICLAGLVMAPLAIRYVRGLDRLTWGALAINGFIGSLVPAVLFAWAQEQLPSAVAGMLNALSPLWTLVLAVGLYGTQVRRKQVAGLLLGFVGALGLMSLKDASGDVHWGSAGMLVLATACYGLSINVVRNRLSHVPAIGISALALSMTAVPAGLGFVLSGGVGAVAHHPDAKPSMLAVVVLAWFGTAAALMLFNALIKKTDVLFASSVTYVIPLFALFWGWMDGEWLGWPHVFFGGVVLSGVRLVAKG
jgi:drug/metabolite transporter (DMT)-like permease